MKDGDKKERFELTALILKTANDLTMTTLKSRGTPVTAQIAIDTYRDILRAVEEETKRVSPYSVINVTIPDEAQEVSR